MVVATAIDAPGFVIGDTRKSLRVAIVDGPGQNANRLDITDGEIRLFALGDVTHDRPTSNPGEGTWNGVLGVIINAASGEVEFQGLGGLLDIQSQDQERYSYSVQWVTPSPVKTSKSFPFAYFYGIKPIT